MPNTTLPLQDRVAIVTGGSRGIGRSICFRLAAEGARIVVNYNANAGMAEEVVKEIEGKSDGSGSSRALAVQADAASVQDMGRLVDETVKKFGRIDIVVAAAGVMSLMPLNNLTEESYDQHMNVNVKGPLFLTQKAAPHMKHGGRVILFSTNLAVASTVPPPYLAYCASKGAVEQLVRLLNKSLAPQGIMVNAVAPGPTATEMFLKGKTEEMINMMTNFIPQKKIAEPEQVADVVAFLAGDGASWVSGQTLLVNGGQA